MTHELMGLGRGIERVFKNAGRDEFVLIGLDSDGV